MFLLALLALLVFTCLTSSTCSTLSTCFHLLNKSILALTSSTSLISLSYTCQLETLSILV